MSWDMPRSRSRASRDSRFPSPESAQSRRGGEDEAEEDGEYPSELEEEEEDQIARARSPASSDKSGHGRHASPVLGSDMSS